jgi:hypothetical protein
VITVYMNLRKLVQKYLEIIKMWCLKRMEKIK